MPYVHTTRTHYSSWLLVTTNCTNIIKLIVYDDSLINMYLEWSVALSERTN